MSSLSTGRGYLSIITNQYALNALVIALRYSHSRKQFENKDKTDEIPIIDYPLTKLRLIPQIALHLLQIPAGNRIARAYSSKTLDFSNSLYITELHAISTAVKARFTWNSITAAS